MIFWKYTDETKEKIFDSLLFLLFQTVLFFIIWLANIPFVLPFVILVLSLAYLMMSSKLHHFLSIPIFLMFSLKDYIVLGNIPLYLIFSVLIYIITFVLFVGKLYIKDRKNFINRVYLTPSILLIICCFALSTFINYFTYNSPFHQYAFVMCVCFCLYLLVLIFISSINKKSGINNYLNIFYAYNILLILELFTKFIDHDFTFNIGWATNKNVPAMALETFLPFMIYIFAKNNKRIDVIIISLLNLGLIVLSKSRGAMLSTTILFPLLFQILLQNKKKTFRYSLILITSILFIILIIPNLRDKAFTFIAKILKGDIFFNGRDIIWKMSFDAFKESPLFGKGFSIFYQIELDYNLEFRGDVTGIFYTLSHNTFLTLLAGGGLLLLFACLYHLYKIFTLIIKSDDKIKYAVLYFILFGLVHGMLDNTFFTTIYMFPYFLIFSSADLNTKRISTKNKIQ